MSFSVDRQKRGKITKWNDDRGFGFITPLGESKQIFVHIKSFKKKNIRPEVNQRVLFNLSEEKEGKISAINVRRVGEKVTVRKNTNYNTNIFGAQIIFFGFLILSLALVLSLKISIYFILFFMLINILSYVMYKHDKNAAENNEWRTAENTLHFLSLIGGWYGAMIAQKKLRHKSKKISFRIVFWITVMGNIMLCYWMLFKGKAFLPSILL